MGSKPCCGPMPVASIEGQIGHYSGGGSVQGFPWPRLDMTGGSVGGPDRRTGLWSPS